MLLLTMLSSLGFRCFDFDFFLLLLMRDAMLNVPDEVLLCRRRFVNITEEVVSTDSVVFVDKLKEA